VNVNTGSSSREPSQLQVHHFPHTPRVGRVTFSQQVAQLAANWHRIEKVFRLRESGVFVEDIFDVRISYTTSLPYTIPKSGSINAAKVLYKVLTPAERNTDIKDILNKYPGFPQAEYLFYPMPICRQLGNLLRESNATYPRGMREMMNLKLGWLSRA